MSYEAYRLFHIIGILMVFMSIGAAIIRARLNDTTETIRKQIMMRHGIGLLVVLVAGFGAMAKAGIPFAGWIAVKFVIWLIIGGIVGMMARMGSKANVMWYVALLLGIVAAYLAIYKPF